mmetsp:Transcript_15588/g.33088  ORF Transcript_15588/g.33088 Transcript_15588/m.33088 type:complete len:243 (+) Transcript_15588:4436-5164(+)
MGQLHGPHLALRRGQDRARALTGQYLEVGHLPRHAQLRSYSFLQRVELHALPANESTRLLHGRHVVGEGDALLARRECAGVVAPEVEDTADVSCYDVPFVHSDAGDRHFDAATVQQAARAAIHGVEGALAGGDDELSALHPGVGRDGEIGICGDGRWVQPGEVSLIGLLDGQKAHCGATDKGDVVLMARVDRYLVKAQGQVEVATLQLLPCLCGEDAEPLRGGPRQRIEAGAAVTEHEIRQL